MPKDRASKTKPTPAKKPTSLVTFLLDRSGSMRSCQAATIEAFNGFLSGLKEEKDAEITFSFLQFDSVSFDKCCVNSPIAQVPDLSTETYQPRGSTPLIDAAVKTIRAVEGALVTRDDNPKIVICIQTDGHENESRQHTWEELRALVFAKTELGWEFNFMGAGIEGYDQAVRMGIGAMNTMSYDSADLARTRHAFAASAANTREFSKGAVMNTAYSVSQRVGSGDKHFEKWIGGTPNTARAVVHHTTTIALVKPLVEPLDLTK